MGVKQFYAIDHHGKMMFWVWNYQQHWRCYSIKRHYESMWFLKTRRRMGKVNSKRISLNLIICSHLMWTQLSILLIAFIQYTY